MKLKNERLNYQYIKKHFDVVSKQWKKDGRVTPTWEGYINHVNQLAGNLKIKTDIDLAAVQMVDQKIHILQEEFLQIKEVIKACNEYCITAKNNSVIAELYFRQTVKVYHHILNI